MNGRSSHSTWPFLILLNQSKSPFWHLQGRRNFSLSFSLSPDLWTFFWKIQCISEESYRIFFIVFLLQGLVVKSCGKFCPGQNELWHYLCLILTSVNVFYLGFNARVCCCGIHETFPFKLVPAMRKSCLPFFLFRASVNTFSAAF